MILDNIEISQIVVKLSPLRQNYFHFDYEKYRARYHRQLSSANGTQFVTRRTIEFVYRISKKLNGFVFIHDKIRFWIDNFDTLLENLKKELKTYIIKGDYRQLYFNCEISNICINFQLTEKKYDILFKCCDDKRDLIACLKIYNLNLIPSVTETNNFMLNYRKNGKQIAMLKCFVKKRRGSIICQTITNFLLFEKIFLEFCERNQHLCLK